MFLQIKQQYLNTNSEFQINMNRKLDCIVIAILLLSIAPAIALEEFSSPEGTFMKIESQEELLELANELDLNDCYPVYLMVTTQLSSPQDKMSISHKCQTCNDQPSKNVPRTKKKICCEFFGENDKCHKVDVCGDSAINCDNAVQPSNPCKPPQQHEICDCIDA